MVPTLKLRTGDELPTVGLGLWKIDAEILPGLIESAVEAGYRHFDSACDYGNEPQVGAGLKRVLDKGLAKRENLWVTSKLWNTYHAAEHVRPACERTLSDLGLDYLDLYLIHFPIALEYVPFDRSYPPGWMPDPNDASIPMRPTRVPLSETWGAMEELKQAGLVRNIGVCNYATGLLNDLMAYASTPPAVLQVELHPYLQQPKLLRQCKAYGIEVTAFSPFGAPSYVPLGMAAADDSVLENQVVRELADAQGKSPAQIVLRWGIDRGTAVIPKTSRAERLRENIDLFDFTLTPEAHAALATLERNQRFNDPGVFCEEGFGTFFPIFD